MIRTNFGVAAALSAACVLFSAGCGSGSAAPPRITHGPWLAAVAPEDVSLWMRASSDAEGVVALRKADDPTAFATKKPVSFSIADDGCRTVRFAGLVPDQGYLATVTLQNGSGTAEVAFRTPRRFDAPQTVRLVFGSCAQERAGKSNPVFPAIRARKPDAFVLIGDTPYIDSLRLDIQRRRYREFFSDPGLAALRGMTATYAVWDDHDFGRNDSDGRLQGKEQARRAFVEWHAEGRYGIDGEGVNSSFRSGAIEVFLLDARWWSGTTRSSFDPARRTLLGAKQQAWLEERLLASNAAFKLLVTGMVWNDAVREKKTDYWGAYPHERVGMFRFLAERKIRGVVLVGGDVHRSRYFVHPSAETGLPYPLHEVVTSPLGHSIHKNAEVGHPNLRFERGEPHAFAELEAATPAGGGDPTLTMRWRNAAGDVLHETKTKAADL